MAGSDLPPRKGLSAGFIWLVFYMLIAVPVIIWTTTLPTLVELLGWVLAGAWGWCLFWYIDRNLED